MRQQVWASTLSGFVAMLLVGSANAAKDRLEVGEVFPAFALRVINPDEVKQNNLRLDDFCGPKAREPKKAIILTFFATYCEPCKREMPFLAALYELYKDKGLMIMSVSIDKENKDIDFVKHLAQKSKVHFPVLSDRYNIVAKRANVSKLPCVYRVSSAGTVAMVSIGYNDDISKRLLDEIRQAIGEPLNAPIPPELATHMTGNKGKSTVAVKNDAADTAAAADSEAK